MGILFDDIIFGPVMSRRLGLSLGVNVLPEHHKFCTFNCVYCECGWTHSAGADSNSFHSRADIKAALLDRCRLMAERGNVPDAITFAGNGEPTLHPDFAGIIDDTLEVQQEVFPSAKVVVLSNSTTLRNPEIFNALKKVQSLMKLDAGTEKMYQLINKPLVPVDLEEIVRNLAAFKGDITIQSLFMKAEVQGLMIDNTTEEEVTAWLGHLSKINPRMVMIYPIDREAPDNNITKVSAETLESIAEKVRALGISVKIFS